MISRRALIGSALAGSALSGLPTIGVAASGFTPAVCIVDRALAGSAGMIAAFNREQSPIHIFSGDPGGVWMHHLEPLLRRKSATIAGYTSASTLFCLQYLARDYGIALKTYTNGAKALNAFADDGPSDTNLIDSPRHSQRGPMTWLLVPKKG